MTSALKTNWIKSPLWDFFLLMSGYWMVPLFFLFQKTSRADLRPFLYLILTIATFHLLAPIFLFWWTPTIRKSITTKWKKYLLIPSLVIFAPLILCLWSFASGKQTQQIVVNSLAIIMLIWNAFHYANYHLGLLGLYAKKTRIYSKWEKNFDTAFCWFLFIILLQGFFFNLNIHLINSISAEPFKRLSIGLLNPSIFNVLLVVYGVFVINEFRQLQISIPRLMYGAMLTLQIGFMYFAFNEFPLAVLLLINFNHWLTETALTSRIILNQSKLRKLNPIKVICGFLIAIMAFRFFFHFSSWGASTTKFLLGVRYDIPEGITLQNMILISALFSFQFLHMLYDRYIFTFRNKETEIIKESMLKSAS